VYFRRKLPEVTMIKEESTVEVELTVEVSDESAAVTWAW
jgi:hypothetical protein